MEKCESRSHRDDISEIDLNPFPFLGLGVTSEIEASAFRNLSVFGFCMLFKPKDSRNQLRRKNIPFSHFF